MKKIELDIEDAAYEKLVKFLWFKKLCGQLNTEGPLSVFQVLLFQALSRGDQHLTVLSRALDVDLTKRSESG